MKRGVKMGWKEVDNKTKTKIDSQFVSCTEKWEMDYIKKVIKEEFPNISDTKIDQAIKECCSKVAGNHPRTKFMQCLQSKLG